MLNYLTTASQLRGHPKSTYFFNKSSKCRLGMMSQQTSSLATTKVAILVHNEKPIMGGYAPIWLHANALY